MAKIPGASKAAKKVTKRGRKSKKGRPVGTKAEKAEAKELGITVPELRKRKKTKKTKGKGKKDPRTLTAKEKAAIKKQNERNRKAARLRQERFEKRNPGIMASQAADARAQKLSEQPTAQALRSSVPSGGRRLSVFAPQGSSVAGQSVEAGPLKSKITPPGTTRQDRVSPARRRQLVGSGMAGVDPRTGLLKQKGTFAPPARQVAEEMGLGRKGVLPTEEELAALGGFQRGRKRGGKVGKNKKRKSSKGVGTGCALRGYGAVRKN